MTVITDITDFKRAEEALARKEAELHVALDNMPGALAYTDDELEHRRLQRPLRRDVSGAARAARSPGRPYPALLRYLAEHGYYGEGDVDALVAQRVESLRNPTGKTLRGPRAGRPRLPHRAAAAPPTAAR